MTTTVYYTATSLDGFIADERNGLDWLFEVPRDDESEHDAFARFFAGVGVQAMGATTYEWVVAHERMLDHPERWMAPSIPTWVFTHRDLRAVPGADLRFVNGEVAPVHAAMVAAADGRDVWLVGGGELVASFADAGLLDRIWVSVQPVCLGAGAPLLPRRLTSKRLTLESAKRSGQQVDLVYAVAPAR